MGSPSATECEFWAGSNTTDGNSNGAMSSDQVEVPWSGGTLGLSDVGFIGARGKPRMIGVIGPHDSGKSTFLAALFLLVLRAGKVGTHLFAGSYSLRGWDQIARHLKWVGNEPPQFPPHTTAFEGRAPGLLQMAFRDEHGDLVDLLFTDGPGEWFRSWAFNRDAIGAEGARWVARHADAFLVFADCAALAGEEKGTARVILKQVIDRLASERSGRPAFLVWSKCDVALSPEIRSSIRRSLELLGDVQELELSVRPTLPTGKVPEHRFLRAAEQFLSIPLTQAPRLLAEITAVDDCFLNFRGTSCE
jgi:hypothetical protein